MTNMWIHATFWNLLAISVKLWFDLEKQIRADWPHWSPCTGMTAIFTIPMEEWQVEGIPSSHAFTGMFGTTIGMVASGIQSTGTCHMILHRSEKQLILMFDCFVSPRWTLQALLLTVYWLQLHYQACKLRFRMSELISFFCCVESSHAALKADSRGTSRTNINLNLSL